MTFKIATANGQDKSKINKYSYWEKWTTSFRGQVTISTGTSNDIPLGRSYHETGIEYIPRISVKKSLKKDRFFDAEWEYKFNKLYTGDSLYNSIEKNHRLWIRYASNKIEARFGLQKMVFGPTQILRPLSWFDTFDLKDPTSQTDGVKAFRLRWYPSNSFSTSSWVLMNEQDTLTIGCRLELSNNLGEWGLTIHQDKSSSLQFLGQLGLPIYGPHSRAAIDYRYDGLFGFWNESAFISSNKSKIRLMTIGADYTLPISNGILIMTETMHLSNQFEDKKSLIKKFKYGELYWDFFNNTYSNFFDEIEDELVFIVKKNSIDKLAFNNSNILNIEYQYNSPIDAINVVLDNQLSINDKNLTKFKRINNKEEFLSEKSIKIIEEIKNFKDFKFKNDEIKFYKSLKKPDNFDNEFGLFKNLKKLKRFKLTGYSPFYGKYLLISKLNNFISTENLEELEIDGLIDHTNISFPYLPKIKKLELTFSYNAYNAILGKDIDRNTKIENFSNLANIEKLDLRQLYETYQSDLVKKIGIDKYSGPQRWHCVEIDFSDIHKLKKLRELNIYSVKSRDLKKIKELPSIESLTFRIFQITEELNPDKGESAHCPIMKEDSFSFLKNSKSLKKITLRIGDIPDMEDIWGEFLSTRYSGNADFLNYINYNITELELDINVEINKQHLIQDIINNTCNRFLKLKKLILRFGIVLNNKTFDWENITYTQNIMEQNLDIKKFIKLKDLEILDTYLWSSAIKFKTINFKEIFNLKKLKEFRWNFESIKYDDFRTARINFKNEKFENRKDYDYDYEYYCEEDSNYAKNWSRFQFINSDNWGDEWLSLEDRFLEIQKKENEKKYKKKETIVKKKIN